MRILIVGAAGVLGRATLPHLGGHDVIGTTRAADRRASLGALGARPELCDVYEAGALARVAQACAPDVVVNFLTDLAGGPGPANSRIRREGGPIVTAAARASGARRLVVESIAFAGSADSAAAVAALEDNAVASGLDVLILRFGRPLGSRHLGGDRARAAGHSRRRGGPARGDAHPRGASRSPRRCRAEPRGDRRLT